jgi:hypothetical protein
MSMTAKLARELVGTLDDVAGARTLGALRAIERRAGWSQYAEPRAAHLEWAKARGGQTGRAP